MLLRVISWFMSFLWMVVRGGLPLSPSLPLLVCLFLSCAQPTDSPDEGTVERERVEVSGSISEDAVWESGKEYVVSGDVIVEAGATLTIQPDGMGKFAHERADDYVGITVKGTLMADGGDSITTILFTSGAAEWARKPGDWRGIEVEASSDSSSVIRYCRIEYANVGIKADGSSPRVRDCVVEQCADTGILFYDTSFSLSCKKATPKPPKPPKHRQKPHKRPKSLNFMVFSVCFSVLRC